MIFFSSPRWGVELHNGPFKLYRVEISIQIVQTIDLRICRASITGEERRKFGTPKCCVIIGYDGIVIHGILLSLCVKDGRRAFR